MRLFTAVDLPDALRETLSDLQNGGSLPARWTDPEQFHVTLRFIGEVSDDQADRYAEVLSNVEVPAFRGVPYGLDVLPSRRSPRVLMLGLERTDPMLTLYRAVSDVLESRQPSGLEPEGRTYRPHVTIARLDDADPEAVQSFIRAHENRSYEPFEIDRFVLYESTLTPDGAIHDPVETYQLGS